MEREQNRFTQRMARSRRRVAPSASEQRDRSILVGMTTNTAMPRSSSIEDTPPATLSIAEKLWHLENNVRLSSSTSSELKRLYQEYKDIILYFQTQREEIKQYEKEQADRKTAYDAKCNEIARSVSLNEASAKNSYSETVKRLTEECQREIARQQNLIQSSYDERERYYENTYVKPLEETKAAIDMGTELLKKFQIDMRDYQVMIDEKLASTTSTQQLFNNIKQSAIEINNIENSATGVVSQQINDYGVGNLNYNINRNDTAVNNGLSVAKNIFTATKGTGKLLANLGSRIKEEREMNKKIMELSEQMIINYKLLVIRKNILKTMCSREKPDDSYILDEKRKIEEAENRKLEVNVRKSEDKMAEDIAKVTIDTIKPLLDEEKDRYIQDNNALNDKRKVSMQELERNLTSKINNLIEELNVYFKTTKKATELYDIHQQNAIKNSPENTIFKQKEACKKDLDVFSEKELLESIDLKLFLPESEKIRDWFGKISFDLSLYEMKNDIDFSIKNIMQRVQKEYKQQKEEEINTKMKSDNRQSMTAEETQELNKVLSEQEARQFLKDKYKKIEQQETDLYYITTSNKPLGTKQINNSYSEILQITKLATNKSALKPLDSTFISDPCLSSFDNNTMLCLYKDEQQAKVLCNFIKNFVYNLLITYHTESVIVNVINPNSNVLFKDLQVLRDYISTSADTKGKKIKGPDYVKLYNTSDEVQKLETSMTRQATKLRPELVGKNFRELVKEKRETGGIVPKFTINVIIRDNCEQGKTAEYNVGGSAVGVLNIYFTDLEVILPPNLDQKTGNLTTSINYNLIKQMRRLKTIVEVNRKITDKDWVLDASYEDLKSHNLFTYSLKTDKELEDMRTFLEQRSVGALKNKMFTTSVEFIDDIITRKGQQERAKEQKSINEDRDILNQEGYKSYKPFSKKYSDNTNFITRNRSKVELFQEGYNDSRITYFNELNAIEKAVANSDTERLESIFKYCESFKRDEQLSEEFEQVTQFNQDYDSSDPQAQSKITQQAQSDIQRRQDDLDYRNKVNPKCYWEGDNLKTLPLYMGYVQGDKTNAQPIILDETQKPHYFIAGTTGGGKSVALATMVNVLKMMFKPTDLEIVYFDFKVAEVAMHAAPYKMPQCSAMCGSSTPEYLISLLNYVNAEMDRRYKLNEQTGTNKLSSLIKYQKNKKKELLNTVKVYKKILQDAKDNNLSQTIVDYIEQLVEQKQKDADDVIIPARMLLLVDEAAQAFQSEDEGLKERVRFIFVRLAQLARAAGIHMVLVSQDADKMPGALMDLLKVRGCTVAPRSISSNVLKNDFCARPENQFIGFFGVNDMDGAEEANVQYVVPLNREEDTPKLSKIADSLCEKMNIPSRNAVIFDDTKIYTDEVHKEQLELHRDELDGNTVFLGEGVYFMKEFVPHKFVFEERERSGAVIISPLESERTRILKTIIDSIKYGAIIAPVYAMNIPKDFPPDYFKELPLNKHYGYDYICCGKDIVSFKEAIERCSTGSFDQLIEGEVLGNPDDAKGKEVLVFDFPADESQENTQYKDFEGIRKGFIERRDSNSPELRRYLNLFNTVYENGHLICIRNEPGLISEELLKQLNEENVFMNTLQSIVADRKERKMKNPEEKFIPQYFIMFELAKDKWIRENSYMFWKTFISTINEAGTYNVHVIISDSSMIYTEKEVGGYYMISNADSVTDIPRKYKGVPTNFMKLDDVTNKYSALVKLPKADPNKRKRVDSERALQSKLESIKENLDPEQVEKLKIIP